MANTPKRDYFVEVTRHCLVVERYTFPDRYATAQEAEDAFGEGRGRLWSTTVYNTHRCRTDCDFDPEITAQEGTP